LRAELSEIGAVLHLALGQGAFYVIESHV
jgi:hypothetical protein